MDKTNYQTPKANILELRAYSIFAASGDIQEMQQGDILNWDDE